MTEIQNRQVARINARSEQKRLDRAAEIQLERERLALAEERRQADERRREAQEAAKASARAERKAARTKTCGALLTKVHAAAPKTGQVLLVAVPILAPMTVAWIGQIQFALDTLGWVFIGALAFAAAWELTTAFTGWMFHQARQDGDRGTLFRAATWLFAMSAGAMNYWHACPTITDKATGTEVVKLDPTPKAVAFGVMSLVGIGLWELYTTLIHRKQLRAKGKLPPARPQFGLARWMRNPVITWTAWSLTIKYQIPTSKQAWALAVAEKDTKRRDGQTSNVRVTVGRMTVVRPIGASRPRAGAARPQVLTTPWGGMSVPGRSLTPALAVIVSGPVGRDFGTWFDRRDLSLAPVAFTSAATHPKPLPQGSAPTPASASGSPAQVTPAAPPQVSPEATERVTCEATTQVTARAPAEGTRQATSGGSPKSPVKSPRKKGRKSSRSDEEIKAELQKIVAAHYRDTPGEEIKVLPVAKQLRIGRDRARDLLAEMNVRPIRKAASE